jgi:hypothetical protein
MQFMQESEKDGCCINKQGLCFQPGANLNRVPGIHYTALQRKNTEISKQILPEKEYRVLSTNFHIHASVSDSYIPTIGLPILLEEYDPGTI